MQSLNKHLQDRIRLLLQVCDSIAKAPKDKSLEKKRNMIAGAVYELAVLKSEETYGRATSTGSDGYYD
jgi:hypothetical protein